MDLCEQDLCSAPSHLEQTEIYDGKYVNKHLLQTTGNTLQIRSLLEGRGLGNTGKFAGRFQDQELLEVAALFTHIVENRREIIVNHYGRKREPHIPSPQKSFEKKHKRIDAFPHFFNRNFRFILCDL